MEHVEGIIKQYLFYNEENSYSVLKVELTDTSEKSLAYYEPTIVVCGFFPKLETQVKYRFYGKVTSHPRFGTQYAAERFERIVDNTRAGLIDYLSSGLIKGVGPKTAERIVDALGTDALAAIAQDVSALDKVPTGLIRIEACLKICKHCGMGEIVEVRRQRSGAGWGRPATRRRDDKR